MYLRMYVHVNHISHVVNMIIITNNNISHDINYHT